MRTVGTLNAPPKSPSIFPTNAPSLSLSSSLIIAVFLLKGWQEKSGSGSASDASEATFPRRIASDDAGDLCAGEADVLECAITQRPELSHCHPLEAPCQISHPPALQPHRQRLPSHG